MVTFQSRMRNYDLENSTSLLLLILSLIEKSPVSVHFKNMNIFPPSGQGQHKLPLDMTKIDDLPSRTGTVERPTSLSFFVALRSPAVCTASHNSTMIESLF